MIYKAMLDLAVEAHHVAEQVCHLGDQSWRGVEDLLGDGDLVFLAGVEVALQPRLWAMAV